MPTIPFSLILSAAERDEIARHLAELDRACGPTPADDVGAEEATLVEVTKMMLTLPARKENEIAAEARGEAFMTAVDDMPTWAVASAIRCWYRGEAGTNESGESYDYHWAPAPAELRRVAQRELWRVKARAATLRRLLCAEPLIEYSAEHCQQMRVKLAKLFCSLGTPPVGKDGSGGAGGIAPADGAYCGTQPRHNPA